MNLLTAENYMKGFLIDDELMGGVTEHPESAGQYAAYVLSPATGEYLGYRAFERLDDALAAINSVKRDWKFESSSGCGSEDCGQKSGGKCQGKNCAARAEGACGTDDCPATANRPHGDPA